MADYGGGFKDLQQVVAHQGIPFDIRSTQPQPSMAEATARRKGPLAEV